MRSRYHIPVLEIPDQGLDLDFETPPDQLLLPETDVRMSGTIRSRVHLEIVDHSVGLDGSVEGDLALQCVRCLQPVKRGMNVDFRIFLELPSSRGSGLGDQERTGEDLEKQFFKGGMICLDEVIRDQVMLEIPPYPLCRDDCRGLCPVCGIELNDGVCHCPAKGSEQALNPLKEQIKKIIKS